MKKETLQAGQIPVGAVFAPGLEPGDEEVKIRWFGFQLRLRGRNANAKGGARLRVRCFQEFCVCCP